MGEGNFSAMLFGRPIQTGSIGGLSTLRQVDLNLIYVIKEKILPINGYVSQYTETIIPDQQELDPNTLLPVTPYTATFYDWAYYNPDPSNPALTGLLAVPTVSVSGNLAYFDYPRGKVYYSGLQTNPITVTYSYYSVAVQDGFPDWGEDPKNWEKIRIPLVSVDFSNRMNIPLYLGGEYEVHRNFIIDVVATSDPQRDDIMDILETSLRYNYPFTIDYSKGFPIQLNGDRNLNFDRGPASRWTPIRFLRANSKVIRMANQNDKLRHHGVIMLDIQIT